MNHRLAVRYAVLALFGTLLPLSEFVPWLLAQGFNVPLFFQQLFANRVSSFFAADVLVSATVLVAFVLAESRRIGMRLAWLPIAGCLTVGVSLGLPLFLFMRERHLGRNARA